MCHRDRTPWLLIALLGAAALVAHALHYWGTWTDDAYISFRYAWRLWHDGALAFNPGERLEGLTNLGWALLLAPASGADVLGVSRVLGLACGVGTVALLVGWCRDEGCGPGATGAALIAMVAAPWVPHWLVQGMETPGAMLLVTLGWSRYRRSVEGRGRGAALGLGLAPWVRPDSALLAPLLGLWHLIRRGGPKRGRRVWAAVGVVLAFAAGLLAVKWAAFGGVVPHTFGVKTRGDALDRGLAYAESFLTVPTSALPALLVVGVAVGLGHALRRDDRALPALVALSWLAMSVVVGGDFMSNFRLLVPAWPALCAGLALLLQAVQDRLGDDLRAVVSVAGLITVAAAAREPAMVFRVDQLNRPAHREAALPHQSSTKTALLPWDRPGWGQGLEGRMPFPAAWTLVHAPDDTAVAYTDIGLLSWAAPHVNVVDLLGLTDAVMGSDDADTRQWPYLIGRVDWLILDVQGGLWRRYQPRLARTGWPVVAGCQSLWVFTNPRHTVDYVPEATLRARLDSLLARAPAHRELHALVAAELAHTGADADLIDGYVADLRALHGEAWWDQTRWMRCALGEDALCQGDVEPCGGRVGRVDPANLADPASWPAPPAFEAPEEDVGAGAQRPSPEAPDQDVGAAE